MNYPIVDRAQRLAVLSLLLLVMAAFQRPAARARPVLLPVDEAPSEPGLLSVRRAMLQALRDGDFERVMTSVADDVKFEFNPGPSKSAIAKTLGYRVGDRTLAEQLIAALSLGGSFTTSLGSVPSERQFCAPYVYSAWAASFPEPNDSEGAPMVLLRKNVAVKASPDSRARTIATLSYNVVRIGTEGVRDGPDGSRWRRVELAPGQGYVPEDSVRDPEDYHVCFGVRGGRWMITAIKDDEFPYKYQ